jgi:cysteine-rich repeat protein
MVGQAAVPAHLAHGDSLGACPQACGNGLVENGEDCDDGNTNPSDRCDNECHATEWNATTVVGTVIQATSFGLGRPNSVALDGAGRIYIADFVNNRVERIDGTTLTRVAGTGVRGFGGDDGPAATAQLSAPRGVAIDGLGRLYIADGLNNCVRRVDTLGIITTIAGTCGLPYSYYTPGTNNTGDGGPARQATFALPESVAVDGLGRLYIADQLNHVVRRIDEAGIIDRVAGTGNAGGEGENGLATSADLYYPSGVAVDGAGALYIADNGNQVIRKIDHPGPPSQPGTIHTVAGVFGQAGYSDDGPVATTRLFNPCAAFVDQDGVLTIAEAYRIRQVVGTDIVTVAGNGLFGFTGDNGPATLATLAFPGGVAVDATGRIVIADSYNNRIRRVDIDASRTITTIAGSGAYKVVGDEAAATSAPDIQPYGVAADAQGNVYFADGFNSSDNSSHDRIRRVDTTGTITTIAGNGDQYLSPIPSPEAVAVDSIGRVFFLTYGDGIVWRADATELVRVAGGGGSTADGALAIDANLNGARAIAFDSMDRLYVSLSVTAGRIRRVDVPNGTTGTITTVAGGGSDTGDTTGPGAPLNARLNVPRGITIDAMGRLYVADAGSLRIVRIDFQVPSLTRIAGGTGNTQTAENVAPLLARMSPISVAVDADYNVFYADAGRHRVSKIDASLTGVTTFAGSQALAPGDIGDGGPATGSVDVTRLRVPQGIAFDATGRLLIADLGNRRVRRVEANGTITTIAGQVGPEGMGLVAHAQLADPRALLTLQGMTLIAGGSSGTVQAVRNGFLEAVVGRYPQAAPTTNLAKFRDSTFGMVAGIAAGPTSSILHVVESHRIQRVTLTTPNDPDTWTIEAFANTAGTAGYADGSAATATFRSPQGLFYDDTVLYVADTGNHVIRQIVGTAVTTIAGSGQQSGFFGDGGPASIALLDGPAAITKCSNGDLFIADTGNNRVRRIHQNVISTVLGVGVADSSGDGVPASAFPVNRPKGLVCDADGNLYISSTDTIRQLPANNGVVDGTGPVNTIYESAKHTCLTGITLIDSETLQVADQCVGDLVELHRQILP